MWYSVTRNEGLFMAAIMAHPREMHSLALRVRLTLSTEKSFWMMAYTAGMRVAPPTTSTE